MAAPSTLKSAQGSLKRARPSRAKRANRQQPQDEGLGRQRRLRFGIGKPQGPNTKDRVVGHFSGEERQTLDEHVKKARDICGAWARDGLQKAMSRWGGK